jgi:hypothetical protein
LEASSPADKEQERRRLEDLPETVGTEGRFPRTRRNFATFRAVCFASAKSSGSFSFRLSNMDSVELSFVILPRTLIEFCLVR